MRRCEHCGMTIQPDVTICPYCFLAVDAVKHCPVCGNEIHVGDPTCSFCRHTLIHRRVPDDPVAVFIAMAKDPLAERERHPIRSNPLLAVYLLIVVVIAALLLWQVYLHLGPGQPRMLVEGVIEQVAAGHPGENLTESEAAAVTAWTALNKTGIPARIRFGSVSGEATDLTAVDRVWVMAEVGQDTWVAGDPVTGEMPTADVHPLYYRGWDYDTPETAAASLTMLTRYRTLAAAVDAGTITGAERAEQATLASSLARASADLTATA